MDNNRKNQYQGIFLDSWHPFLWIASLIFLVYSATLFFNIVYLDDNVLVVEHYFFNKDIFRKLHSVIFINIGRGLSVDVPDLLSAIAAGNIEYAVLDVFEEEPLPANSPLWLNPKVFVTPHHSGITDFEDIKDSFTEVYSALKEGKSSRLFVDRIQGY